jgi:ParB-like nuclease domain
MDSQTEERIGKHRVHPVASMFPLIDGTKYDELRASIQEKGQQHPIVVMGDMLLDGRNRLRVCLQLGIEPRIEEYRSGMDPVDYIQVSNLDRRHLTDDARVAICAKINQWLLTQSSAKKKAEVGAAQGHHGAEGGRGHKKPLNTDSGSGVSKRDVATMHANSTVGQLAADARGSHYKAAQAVYVAKTAPALVEKVIKGEMKLKDAFTRAKAAAPARSRGAETRRQECGRLRRWARAQENLNTN